MIAQASPDSPGASPILIVAGPTASGKSALALKLAEAFNGEIVNADSVQVYREADIGSAKPGKSERAAVPHHLIDYCDPSAPFNTAEYVKAATKALDELAARGKKGVVTGGSTLYITHLLHGVAELPPGDAELRRELDTLSNAELVRRLSQLDPESAARIHPNDRLRLGRAIEASLVGGKRASEALREHAYRGLRFPALILVIVKDREELYRRINARTAAMIEDGLVEETRGLMEKYGTRIKLLKTLGYREAVDFIEGKLERSELANEIAMNTRRYAKRQLTFWRNEPSKRCWSSRPQTGDTHVLIDAAEAPLGRKLKPMPALDMTIGELAAQAGDTLSRLGREIKVWYITARDQ